MFSPITVFTLKRFKTLISNKKNQRYLGIDFGEKFIGIAAGQNITGTASALKVIANNAQTFEQIKQIIGDYRADTLVIGLPVGSQGEALFTTSLTEKFALELKKQFNLPIHFVDERYTTCDIQDEITRTDVKLKTKKQRKDALSAKLILQQFLSS